MSAFAALKLGATDAILRGGLHQAFPIPRADGVGTASLFATA
ncbi:MAG: hypothetical protein ACP5M0_05875 [Desulfomonilaceae bacterium]